MNISSISSTAYVQRPQRPEGGPKLDQTAEKLGLTSDDLQSALKSGTTLNELAEAQGVSSDDLLTALKADLTTGKPADVPDLSDDQLTEMATDIAAGKKGPGGPGGPGGPPPSRPTGDAQWAAIAQNASLDPSALLGKLSAGQLYA